MAAPDQLPFAGLPTRLFACTPSRLAAFDCPRRYRFTYVDRPRPVKGPPWAHNSVGAAAHLALARWWDLLPQHRTPARGAELVRRNWTSPGVPPTGRCSSPVGGGFRDQAQSDEARERTAGWVEAYLTDLDPAHEPVGVERTVGAPAGRLSISGRVDRIDEAEDRSLVVVDYKTGRRPLSDADARGSLALALYVLGTRRALRRDCRRVELHHLPTGDVLSYEHTEQSLARHLARAEATADDIQAALDTVESGADPDEVFAARPSPACSWCDFRAHCPEGRAASNPVDPWAGLGDCVPAGE